MKWEDMDQMGDGNLTTGTHVNVRWEIRSLIKFVRPSLGGNLRFSDKRRMAAKKAVQQQQGRTLPLSRTLTLCAPYPNELNPVVCGENRFLTMNPGVLDITNWTVMRRFQSSTL